MKTKVKKSRLPEGNIFWTDIPHGAKVRLVGKKGSRCYVVTLPDRSRKVAYWTGQDGDFAQRFLDRAAGAGKPKK
ncbi:MAG: hypothetical protein ACRETL_02105 [Gammaproteobacteria bacterium]